MNMESGCDYEKKTLIHELTQGLQMAERLRVNLHSPEKRDFLIQKILSSYENALFVLRSGDSSGQHPAPAPQSPSQSESLMSFGSPGSEEFEFDQPFSCRKGENIISKKRKGSITWEDEVRICSDSELEAKGDDGYNWRKYGQKEIQGSKFPRSYYRCSYQKAQKCFATKQVQRKDEDPAVIEIVYNGIHTCNRGAQSGSPPLSASPSPLPSPSSSPSPTSFAKHEITTTHHHHHQLSSPSPSEMLSNLTANLSVNTSDLGGNSDMIPSSFLLPSTSAGLMDDELLQVYSPPFISPVTSESNIFTEWGSSQSLDFLADYDTDFEFNNSLF